MADDHAHEPETIDQSRRLFFSWAGSLGLTGLFGSTLSDIISGQEARGKPEQVPEPYAQSPSTKGDPHSDVYHTHPLELPGMRERVARATEENNPNAILSQGLKTKLRSSPRKKDYSLLVRTVGRRNDVTSTGGFKRHIHGWQPDPAEVQELQRYGVVGSVPEFTSTTVSLHNVNRDDIRQIAKLDFVIDVEYFSAAESNLKLGASNKSLYHTDTKEAVRSFWTEFGNVETQYDFSLLQRIGVHYAAQ